MPPDKRRPTRSSASSSIRSLAQAAARLPGFAPRAPLVHELPVPPAGPCLATDATVHGAWAKAGETAEGATMAIYCEITVMFGIKYL